MGHRAGDQIWAGCGYSTVLATMDFETYSEAGYVWNESTQKWATLPGLKKYGLAVVGAHVYAEHPSAEVLCLSYDLKDGRGVRSWAPWLDAPADLFAHIQAGGLIEAHNAGFEFLIWHFVCARRYGWPVLPLRQMRCSMAKARAYGLPGGLGDIGKVLNPGQQKDPKGAALIKKFCCPRNPTAKDKRRRILPGEDPEGFRELQAYCDQDVRAEAAVSEVLPDLCPDMQELWFVDQEVNNRGVYVDREGVEACISVIEQAAERYTPEVYQCTGGAVASPSQVAALTAWMHGLGIHVDSLDEEAVDELLGRQDLPTHVRRVLEVRALLSSGSVKKLYSLRARIASDGRVHGLFVFHKARTGRYAGEGPQPQNLPSSGPSMGEGEWGFEKAQTALAVIKTRSLDAVETCCGPALHTVSGCLRALFCAAPGCDLICSDYRAIEAVALAALSGEEWRLEVFRTHGLIYETSAAKIMGVDVQEFVEYKKAHGSHHPMRKKLGKVAELASGYRGWINAWKAFGADAFFNDDEIKGHILAWRKASPTIPEFWGGQSRGWGYDKRLEYYGIEGAAISAVLQPGAAFGYRGVTFQMAGRALFLRLPSGRILVYHAAELEPNDRGEYSLTFETWNTNPKYGPMGWCRMSTHGGKLTENIVQAVSFDILAHAQIALARAGYATVLHVHDENVAEVPAGTGDVGAYEAIMGAMPAWAQGWPIIAAGGWRGDRYRKD